MNNTEFFINTIKKVNNFILAGFFKKNIKDLTNIWKGIKKIISSNNSNHIFPTAITVNNEKITNPSDIASALNNYFAKFAIDIQSSIRFSMKNILITPLS